MASAFGAVSAKVATVVLTVDGPTNPQVTIDGQVVPTAALGLKRPVDPGSHQVKVSADGYIATEATFQVGEGGATEAKLKMDKAPGGAVAGPAPGPTEPGPDTGPKNGGGSKTPALIAFGVGGAGLLVGAITGIIAIGKHGDLKDKCNSDGNCPNNLQSDVDSYKSMGTISTIGFIVAGVGGATGVVLLLTASPKESATAGSSRYATVPSPAVKKSEGASVSAYFGGTSAGVAGRF